MADSYLHEDAHAIDTENDEAMRCPERSTPPVPTGTYREHRRALVMWIANKSNRFGLKTMTIHYATNYLDRSMPLLPVATNKYHVLAAACLLIAAKFEERPDQVPFISEIVREDEQRNPLEDSEIRHCELQILKVLDWRLHCSTYLHFLDLYKAHGFVATGDLVDNFPVTAKARIKLLQFIYFFGDMLLLDPDFCAFPKTLSTAAIIATARHTVRMEPVWPDHLAASTGFSAQEISGCVDLMVVAFCRDWPESAPDHLRWPADEPRKAVVITTSCPDDMLYVEEEAEEEQARNDILNEDVSVLIDKTNCMEDEEGDMMIEHDSWCSTAPTEVNNTSLVDQSGLLVVDFVEE